MMKTISFIHVADLHLDSPFKGLGHLPDWLLHSLRESSFRSLEAIIETAIDHRVDFIILAGDLFDQEYRSLRAQLKLKRELERVKQYHIQVYISFGNHDHLAGEWAELSWDEHVHFFPATVESFTYENEFGTTANIYGFSYEKRAQTARMAKYYEKQGEADFHIGVLHGQVDGNTEHGVYAPFSVSELLEKDFDYWALGHLHKRSELAKHIVYPGNIQGRNKKENGEKGCLLVTLYQGEVEKKFIETAPIVWSHVNVELKDITSIQELLEKCEHIKDECRVEKGGVMLTLTFVGQTELHATLHIQSELEAVIEELNEGEERADFVWLASIEVETKNMIDWTTLTESEHFLADVLGTTEQLLHERETVLKPILTHRQARKYLTTFSEEEWERVIEQAKELVVSELIGELEQ